MTDTAPLVALRARLTDGRPPAGVAGLVAIDYERVVARARLVFDTWNAARDVRWDRAKVVRL